MSELRYILFYKDHSLDKKPYSAISPEDVDDPNTRLDWWTGDIDDAARYTLDEIVRLAKYLRILGDSCPEDAYMIDSTGTKISFALF